MNMGWLQIPIACLIVLACFFGSAFLGSAWERRRKRNDEIDSLLKILPGYDCGLCGKWDCRYYARSIVEEGGDPGLCAPGGNKVEDRIRVYLSDHRSIRKIAFVRCGRLPSNASKLFSYSGRRDCLAASHLFSGPDICTDACIGFGTCVSICPVRAIKMEKDLAVVDPALCTGCGLCVEICPTKVIRLVNAESRWHVACNSHRPAESKRDCAQACVACGECVRLSSSWEFAMNDNLAHASETVPSQGVGAGDWENIAAHCPARVVIKSGCLPEEKDSSRSGTKKT
jgi:Na+-translocating ferredoxin:NAD+ oxidoreductase subunit B